MRILWYGTRGPSTAPSASPSPPPSHTASPHRSLHPPLYHDPPVCCGAGSGSPKAACVLQHPCPSLSPASDGEGCFSFSFRGAPLHSTALLNKVSRPKVPVTLFVCQPHMSHPRGPLLVRTRPQRGGGGPPPPLRTPKLSHGTRCFVGAGGAGDFVLGIRRRECRVEVGLRRFLTQSISANPHGAPGPLTRDQRRIGQDGALYKCRLLPT